MTIIEAINRTDAVKPNSYSQAEKIYWLSTLDGTIKAEIIDTHESADSIAFKGYDETTPITTELIVPHPYDEVYIKWLEAQIDYANGEYGKYNNSITMYNVALSAFEKHHNRDHMPKARYFTHF